MEKKEQRWKAAVVTLSDKGYAGEREDKSGPLLCGMLEEAGYEVTEVRLLPDEQKMIATTGGTGFAPRDCTPEATFAVATKNAPGIAEAMRLASLQVTPRATLSRGASVIRNQTLIINFPGSPKAVKENLEAVLPSLEHGLAILTGNASECGKPASEGK